MNMPAVSEERLDGLVVLNTLQKQHAGMNQAIRLVEPFLRDHNVHLHYVASSSARRFFPSTARLMQKRQFHYDFVLFNALASVEKPLGLWLGRVCRRLGIPLVLYWREMDSQIEEFWARKPGHARQLQRLLRAGRWLAFINTEASRRSLQQIAPDVPVVVVGNCAHVPSPFDVPLPPSTEPPIVVNVGSIQPRKGTDLFVETAIRVCQQHPTVEFVWVGGGTDYGEWAQAIEAHGLQRRILFAGHMENPAFLLRRASVFFLTSRAESFSQALAEAMCLGRTIVTFESGGPVEVLGGLGTVIPNFDSAAAANTILDALRKPAAALVDLQVRQRYLDLYTPQKQAERLNNALRRHVVARQGGVTMADDRAVVPVGRSERNDAV